MTFNLVPISSLQQPIPSLLRSHLPVPRSPHQEVGMCSPHHPSPTHHLSDTPQTAGRTTNIGQHIYMANTHCLTPVAPFTNIV